MVSRRVLSSETVGVAVVLLLALRSVSVVTHMSELLAAVVASRPLAVL